MTPWQLRQAVRCLRSGGILAHPTEGVWGLACDPLNPFAVNRLLSLKGRDPGKGLILVAERFQQLRPYLQADLPYLEARVLPTWPGPVTWVLPAAGYLPAWITGGRDTVAVRVTAHPVAAGLAAAFGDVLVSTSANPSGRTPALSACGVRRRFPQGLDYLLAGNLQTPGKPSEIREGNSGKLLRPRS